MTPNCGGLHSTRLFSSQFTGGLWVGCHVTPGCWDVLHMSSHPGSPAKEAALLWDVPVLTAAGKSERLNQNHSLTFKALAWTEGASAHISLLSPSPSTKPNITVAGRVPHLGREGSLMDHRLQQHFGVYILSDFSIGQGVCVHVYTF